MRSDTLCCMIIASIRVIDLTPSNVKATFAALASAGYRPIVPVTAEQLGSDSVREALVREKGMRVLQFWSDQHKETPVDVFAEDPFDFGDEYERALVKPLTGAGDVRFVSIPTLIRMKELAGRPQDRIDIEHLKLRLDDDV